MTVQLFCGDCLEIMPTISRVDAVVTDPPYGTTACKWDSVIPFAPMWEQLKRIIKPNGAIVLFGSEPFSSLLRCSNLKMYKYDWIWKKSKATNFFNANRQPLKKYEIISVFSDGKTIYHPQKEQRDYVYIDKRTGKSKCCKQYHDTLSTAQNNGGLFHPTSIIEYAQDDTGLHPTQKPVALLEYLIKTYTNEGETVLDFTCGSGSTGVAAVNLGRSFIGIEKDPQYFEIAKERIAEAERRKNNEFFVKKPTEPTLFDFMLEGKQ